MQDTLSKSADKNVSALKNYFNSSIDFYTKKVSICGFECQICMFEGLSSIERLWIMMLDAMSSLEQNPNTPAELFDCIMRETDIPMESKIVACLDDARKHITAGASVIFINGYDKAVVISTQSMQYRSVSEPSGEGNIRGSKEAFTEPLRVNISLVRRLIRTNELTTVTLTAGKRTMTEVAILYDQQLVPKSQIDSLKKKIENSPLPFVFDSSYLASFICKGGFSLFSAAGYTERPTVAAAKICEGKVVVLVNGSPFAMIVPYFFSENFQSLDDYAEKAYFASFVRLLKYAAFFIAIMLPGVFVSAAGFTPEVLPQQMLYKVAASEQATPLPLFAEMLLVNFMLEIVREAGLRLPKPVGHSVSLVAAIIVGDAAVNAGLLGTPTVVVAALTTISTFLTPSLYAPVTVLRVLFILAGGILGPIGIAALFFCMTAAVCGMRTLNYDYCAPIIPLHKSFFKDGILRRSWSSTAKDDFKVTDLKDDGN
ncbi:MAG: spore germination protein [Ruminococcaceae bacterium]|nr:spore germination protein [Oscillospiraceae bacterium]